MSAGPFCGHTRIMGRGRSPAEINAALSMVATRQGDVRGTEIEGVDGLELDGDEQVALRLLVQAERAEQGRPGFDAAALGVPDELLTSLESKGLAERAGSERSYCASTAGIQLIGAFASAEWSAAEVSFD